jgi:hypothetical protein
MTKFVTLFTIIASLAFAQTASDNLLQPEHLEYQGAFRMPAMNSDGTNMGYTRGEIAYNPDNNSILITSHAYHQKVAEFPVPDPVKSKVFEELPQATAINGWKDMTGGKLNAFDGRNMKIHNLFVYDSRLFFSLYKYYNVDCQDLFSHGASRMDFNNLDTKGMWRIGQGGYSDWTLQYMAEVPAAWQEQFTLAGTVRLSHPCRQFQHQLQGQYMQRAGILRIRSL